MAQTILLVEDDPINIRFMSVCLKKKGGYEVLVSEVVEEILELARTTQDLVGIIMDISLSRSHHNGQKVDGVYITRLLKQDPATAKIPVMLATAHAMFGDREKFLAETGAEGYLSKPIHDPDAFIQAVQQVVGKQ
jgi:CheY-like chemotaxis protein